MASNVIDLVSSSPPRHIPRRPTTTTSSRPTPVEIHSGDFCSDDDEVLTATHVDDRRTKRPRLSEHNDKTSLSNRDASVSAAPSRPVDADKAPVGCITSAEADSLFVSSPLPLASLQRSRTDPGEPLDGRIPDSDPFASSPPKAAPARARITLDLLSDPFASSSPARPPIPAGHLPASREPVRPLKRAVAAWDPISSSAPCSSAPQPTTSRAKSRSPSVISIGDSSDVGASSDVDLPAIGNFDLSQSRPSYHSYLSKSAPKAKAKQNTTSQTKSKPPRPKPSVDPAQRAATKAAEKEQKRQEREREKEERQRQRDVAAAIVEVNKAKSNRKVSTKEMIVQVPSSLSSTIKVQLATLLDGLEVQHQEYDSPAQTVVKWKRKINSQFDDESGQWVPMPLRVEKEAHALIVMTAEEVVQLAVDNSLDAHMDSLKRQFPDEKLIYMLQGVTAWMRKNRNLRNRQFAAGVRSQDDTQTSRRRAAAAAEPIDEDVVEDAILRLQIDHDVLIHHTAIPLETAQWIAVFTQNISTIPYKRQRDEDTAGARFCMDSGQVKTGEGARDTYVRMLQEIFRVTAPTAYGVAAEFGTVTRLVEGLEAKGPGALEMLRRSANKDGAYSERTIGQAVSKRFYKIFTGRDETSTDI